LNAAIQSGANTVIVNADDWGRDALTTDRILDCVRAGAVSSVSAMVYMKDSARAAALAAEHGIDAGLHLNLTSPFSASHAPARLQERQTAIKRFLRAHRLARIIYHPALAAAFRYVVEAQMEEFVRIHGQPLRRLDGHHHMHLCTNILCSSIIPAQVIVRRSLSPLVGESAGPLRLYRAWRDRLLARRHPSTDFFFNLMPLDATRLQAIFAQAAQGSVELMTHPLDEEEYRFLMDGGLSRFSGPAAIARGYHLAVKERL
jgi:predicted glycoside hydrolase/deacetylase ChbG (UPF0249 family)